MVRRKDQSQISFFSFQDVMMSVCGIVILVTLLLVLKLVIHDSTASQETTETFTEQQLQETRAQVELLETQRREIHDEIVTLSQARDAGGGVPWTPAKDKIDTMQAGVSRIEKEIDELQQKISSETSRTEELKKNKDAVIVFEKEKILQELNQLAESLVKTNKELTVLLPDLRKKAQEMVTENATLDRELASNVKSNKIQFSTRKSTDKTPWIVVYDTKGISVMTFAEPEPKLFKSENEFLYWIRKNRNPRTEYFVVYLRPSRISTYETFLKNIRSQGFDLGLDLMSETTEFSIEQNTNVQ
ncbi:MAG: hypothetical protein ACRC2T_19555 [Thermoguttaceae bacterium]